MFELEHLTEFTFVEFAQAALTEEGEGLKRGEAGAAEGDDGGLGGGPEARTVGGGWGCWLRGPQLVTPTPASLSVDLTWQNRWDDFEAE